MEIDFILIQPSSPEPIYRQIAQQLRRLITGGQLVAGEELPSVRDVAGQYAINPMTVSRAYTQLESEGLLERRRGKSMVVAERLGRPVSLDRRLRQLDPALEDVCRQARELSLPTDTVLKRMRELLEDDK